jgi:putative addiction module killer protein
VIIEVRRYITRSGKDVIGDWLARLGDDRAKARILARIDRLALGNIGDSKRLGSGVSELRVDYGPGYRVYYAMTAQSCVLLLCEATNGSKGRIFHERWSTFGISGKGRTNNETEGKHFT